MMFVRPHIFFMQSLNGTMKSIWKILRMKSFESVYFVVFIDSDEYK